MKKQLTAVLAGLSLIGAGAAFADDTVEGTGGSGYGTQDELEQAPLGEPGTGEEGTSGAGTLEQEWGSDDGQLEQDQGMGGAGQAQLEEAERQISGTVVKAERRTLHLEHMGAVIPLEIDRQTRFEGADVERAGDLQEGQEVRVTFEIENEVDNVARSVSLSGVGGGGLEQEGTFPQDGTFEEGQPQDDSGVIGPGQGEIYEPYVPGTGGAGTDDGMGQEPWVDEEPGESEQDGRITDEPAGEFGTQPGELDDRETQEGIRY